MAKAGRKTDYIDDYARQGGIAARQGMTNKQMAELFDCSLSTLAKWMSVHPEFSDAIKKGRDEFDTEGVENALLKRALGSNIKEETALYDTNGQKTEVKIVKKQLPPDTGAAAFWLKNRNPDRWRDKPEPDKPPEDTAKNLSDALKIMRGEMDGPNEGA